MLIRMTWGWDGRCHRALCTHSCYLYTCETNCSFLGWLVYAFWRFLYQQQRTKCQSPLRKCRLRPQTNSCFEITKTWRCEIKEIHVLLSIILNIQTYSLHYLTIDLKFPVAIEIEILNQLCKQLLPARCPAAWCSWCLAIPNWSTKYCLRYDNYYLAFVCVL